MNDPNANTSNGQSPALRVLFVDDNETLLRAMDRFMSRLCDLNLATNGLEALEIFEAKGPFQVVVTDQRMPKMMGDQLIEKLNAIAPTTKCILITGNANDEAVSRIAAEGDLFRLLSKPSRPTDIWNTITEAHKSHLQAEHEALTAEVAARE